MLLRTRNILLSLAAVLVGVALIAAAPAKAPGGGVKPSQGICAKKPRRGNLYVQITIAGVGRTAIVHVPKTAQTGQSLPVDDRGATDARDRDLHVEVAAARL